MLYTSMTFIQFLEAKSLTSFAVGQLYSARDLIGKVANDDVTGVSEWLSKPVGMMKLILID